MILKNWETGFSAVAFKLLSDSLLWPVTMEATQSSSVILFQNDKHILQW